MFCTAATAACVVASSAGVPASGEASATAASSAPASPATGEPCICGVGVPGGSAGASHGPTAGLASGVASWAYTVVPRPSPPASNASAAQPVTSNRANAVQPKAVRLHRDLDIVVAPPLI